VGSFAERGVGWNRLLVAVVAGVAAVAVVAVAAGATSESLAMGMAWP
jgi:hypothetical protein